mmetsp:Transcript_15268/g.30888  ORF Transcript_15268/g.30888 Transcript_15268/m.30888 type:complete len:217 (-) Transcript_15268:256-906(-)
MSSSPKRFRMHSNSSPLETIPSIAQLLYPNSENYHSTKLFSQSFGSEIIPGPLSTARSGSGYDTDILPSFSYQEGLATQNRINHPNSIFGTRPLCSKKVWTCPPANCSASGSGTRVCAAPSQQQGAWSNNRSPEVCAWKPCSIETNNWPRRGNNDTSELEGTSSKRSNEAPFESHCQFATRRQGIPRKTNDHGECLCHFQNTERFEAVPCEKKDDA